MLHHALGHGGPHAVLIPAHAYRTGHETIESLSNPADAAGVTTDRPLWKTIIATDSLSFSNRKSGRQTAPVVVL